MSIRRKLVTALTTAGLLAGLFGSAFVPTASAVGSIDQYDSYIFFPNSGDADDGYIDYNTKPGYDDGVGAGSDGENNAGVDDGYQLQFASWAEYGRKDSKWCGRYYDQYGECDQYDNSIGIYLENNGEHAYETVDLTATATGGKIRFAWAQSTNGGRAEGCWQPHLNWSTTSSTADDYDSTRGSYYYDDADADDDLDDFEDGYWGFGYYHLCVSPVSLTTLGNSVITIKANNVTVAVVTVNVMGDLAELELSTTDGQNRVSADNAEYGKFWTVVGKDAAGQSINEPHDGFNNDLEDWVNDSIDQGTEDVLNSDDNVIDFFDEEGEYYAKYATLPADTCLEGDAGESYGAYMEIDAADGDLIESNTVNLTCTGSADDYEVVGIQHETGYPVILEGEADWAASDAAEDDGGVVPGDIEVWAKLVDADGRVLGVDGSSGFVFADISYDYDDDQLNFDEYTSQVLAGGYVLLGDYVPNVDTAKKYEIEITIEQSDSDLDDFVKSVYYLVRSIDSDYTLTFKWVNAAKTKGRWTVDWGLECSNSLVFFDWTNRNGTKGTMVNGASPLVRRADFDGVAKLTLAKRNMRIFVTAYACDDFSDSPDELTDVSRRFR
jgi:hypothetical protein